MIWFVRAVSAPSNVGPGAHEEEQQAQSQRFLRRRTLQPEAHHWERLSRGGHLREVARQVPVRASPGLRPARDGRMLVGSDLALFSFDGPDLDSGTVAEFMLAKFADIPSVILRSDRRGASDRSPQWNPMANYFPRTIIL